MKREILHVTAAQHEALRKRLVRRAWELMDEIDAGLHSGSLEVGARDAPTDDVEASVTAAAAERDSAEMRDIKAALARMDAGIYGLCTQCGAAMPWTRLDAVPEAARCMRCESSRERRKPAPAKL
jgi:RNA polymerase-binding transcription factor DksA